MIALITAAAVVLCLTAVFFRDSLTEVLGGTGVAMEYQTALFDKDSPIRINILMDASSWDAMLQNAMTEEYVSCDVEINGTTFRQVGIRPKGNTSLSSIAMDPTTNRFSFKLEFDHYVKGQTCFGLDKLILNNNYADATNMKEALVFDMYSYLGADASLSNYAEISVNGEYWGIYLALEGVEDSFLLRSYGVDTGKLYKPESMGMGGGQGGPGRDFGGIPSRNSDSASQEEAPFGASFGGSFGGRREEENTNQNPLSQIQSLLADADQDALKKVLTEAGFTSLANAIGSTDTLVLVNALNGVDTDQLKEALEAGGFAELAEQLNSFAVPGEGGPGGGFSFMGGGGANLNYTDDSLDSYSTIWEGAVSKVKEADEERVVEALKHASDGTELETYLDVDNLLKYMAVHIFSVNADSLSGSMSHNYYLYEYNGQLNLIPWDYNLSFGGMGGMGGRPGQTASAGATGTVNSPIDDAWNGTHFFDKLLENEEYLTRYHEYLRQLVEGYIKGGRFDEFYQKTRNQISNLVATDPNAFYTAEEYETAAQTLYEIVTLRGQSVVGQLNGTIPSTDAGQMQDSSALVDASHLDTSVMGTMNMGGGQGNFDPFGGQSFDASAPFGSQIPGDMPGGFPEAPQGGAVPDNSQMPSGFGPSQGTGSNAPAFGDNVQAGQMPEFSAPTGNAPAVPGTPENGQASSGMPASPPGMDFSPSSGESNPRESNIPEAGGIASEPMESEPQDIPQQDTAVPNAGQFPKNGFSGTSESQADSSGSSNAYFLLAASCLFLILGFSFVFLFRQNPRKR